MLSTYLNPFVLQKEILSCKKINIGKIKFAKIIRESNTLMIATDDPDIHTELNSPWPIDAFASGICFPKPKTTSINAAVHHVPVDIQLNEPEVISELESQGITSATRRHNKATKEPTQYVTIHINSKQAAQNLLSKKLKLQQLLQIQSHHRPKSHSMFPMPENRAHCSKLHQPSHLPKMWRRPQPQRLLSRAQMCQLPRLTCRMRPQMPEPKPVQPTKPTSQPNNNNHGKSWSAVVANNTIISSKQHH